MNIKYYLVLADNGWLLSHLEVLGLVFFEHVINFIHIFVAQLALVNLHWLPGLWAVLVHAHFYAVYVKLLSVALNFLAFVSDRIGSLSLLVLGGPQGVLLGLSLVLLVLLVLQIVLFLLDLLIDARTLRGLRGCHHHSVVAKLGRGVNSLLNINVLR